MNQTVRFPQQSRREPHSAAYSNPFPIAAPAACMVHTDLAEGGVKQKLIQFSSKDDRKWLSKHAFWAMCEGHRLTTYIIAGADLAEAKQSVQMSRDLETFLKNHN
jgi:hypothetical protein